MHVRACARGDAYRPRWTRGVRYRAPGRRRRGELVHWFDDSSGVGAVHLTGACGLSWGASSQRDAPWDPT